MSHGQQSQQSHERSSPCQPSLVQVLTARATCPMPGSITPPDLKQYRNVVGHPDSPRTSLHNDASSTSERLPGIDSIFMSNAASPAQDAFGHGLTSPSIDHGRAFAPAQVRDSPTGVGRSPEIGQFASTRTQHNTIIAAAHSSVKREQEHTSPTLSSDASRQSTAYPFQAVEASSQPPVRYAATPQPYILYGRHHQDHSTQPIISSHVSGPTTAYGHRRKTSSSSGHSGTRPPVPVSQVSVPGQGNYFRYSDGAVVPAQVEGLPVNPQYGITKQGLPRKRGSHACQSCRNKKIKCELDSLNSSTDAPCKACARTSSECQWEHHTSDDYLGSESYSSPGMSSDGRRRRRPQTPSDGASDSGRPHSFPNSANGQFYEARSYPPHIQPRTKRPKLEHWPSIEATSALTSMHFDYRASYDPIQANKAVTHELLDLYFAYRNGQCNQVIPMAAFLRWVDQCTKKKETDLMIMYACMALGSIYTSDPKLKNAGHEAWRAARNLEINRAGHYDSQLALTRLHLALYSYAKDEPEMSFEYTSTACRTLAALRYNTEAGCAARANDVQNNEFLLEPPQVIEFRRRVFWLAYLTERYNGHCSGSSGLLPNSDVFVRVPSTTDAYDGGTTEVGPLFNQGKFEIHPTATGVMAAFVAMSSLWGEVTKNIFHMANKAPDDQYAEHFETFHSDITRRVDAWKAALPESMRYKPSNTHSNLKEHDSFATYFVLHSIHHGVVMKLSRHFHYHNLPIDSVKRKLRTAHAAARSYLDLIAAINKHIAEGEGNIDLDNALSQPFPGYATLMASDIITRGGPLKALANANSSVIQAEKILHELSRDIAPAKKVKQLVSGRVQELGGWRMMLQSGPPIPERHGFGDDYRMPWKSKNRIERIWVPTELDAVYGVEDHVWVDAVWEGK